MQGPLGRTQQAIFSVAGVKQPHERHDSNPSLVLPTHDLNMS